MPSVLVTSDEVWVEASKRWLNHTCIRRVRLSHVNIALLDGSAV